jgi:hypothetical protein
VLLLLAVTRDNIALTEYLTGQVFQSSAHQFATFRQFFPKAGRNDWREAVAAQRVQIIKPDEQGTVAHGPTIGGVVRYCERGGVVPRQQVVAGECRVAPPAVTMRTGEAATASGPPRPAVLRPHVQCCGTARPLGAESNRRDHQNRSQKGCVVPCRQAGQRCPQSAEGMAQYCTPGEIVPPTVIDRMRPRKSGSHQGRWWREVRLIELHQSPCGSTPVS